MIYKRLFYHTFWYGVSPQISKIASFVLLPILTQFLEPLDFGIYGVIQAYVVAFTFLKTMGLDYLFANSFIKHAKFFKLIWSSLFTFLSVWSVVISILLSVTLWFTFPEEGLHNRELIILLSVIPIAFFSSSENLYFRYLQLTENPKGIAVRNIIVGVLNVTITYITIVEYNLGYIGWFIANFISLLVGFLISLRVVIKLIQPTSLAFRGRRILHYFQKGLPVLPHYYGNYLLDSSDRVVMDLINVNASEIGKYNLSYTIANSVNILSAAVKKAVAPILLKYYKEGVQGFQSARRLTYTLQVVFLLLTWLMVVWSPIILEILVNNENFGDLSLIFGVIVLSFNYVPMYSGANSQLFYYGKVNNLWKRALVAGFLNVTINVLLIPRIGIIAAAISSFISYMYLGFSTFYMRDYKETNPLNYYPVIWFILIVIVAVSSLLIKDLSFLFKLTASIVSILATFVALRKINNQ